MTRTKLRNADRDEWHEHVTEPRICIDPTEYRPGEQSRDQQEENPG